LSRLERLLGERQKGGLVFPEQIALGRWLPTGALGQIDEAAFPQLSVQRLQGINLWDWHQEVPSRKPHQPLDVSPLVGPPHQAEVLLEQIMALQPQELLGQLALAPLQHFDHGNGQVVVADPLRHTLEELEGPAMPFQEDLGTFSWESLNEDRSRVGQRHHEQGDLRLLACQMDRGCAEIDLGFTRRMRQRQENLLMHLLPGPNGILDRRVATLEAVLVPQSLEDPLGRMPLLLRSLAVVLQDLMDDRQEALQLPLLPWLARAITGRLCVRQNLL
jgi:hypothetical protein